MQNHPILILLLVLALSIPVAYVVIVQVGNLSALAVEAMSHGVDSLLSDLSRGGSGGVKEVVKLCLWLIFGLAALKLVMRTVRRK